MRISDWSSDVCSSDLLMEDDESLAEAVELGKLRAINALLARRVCDVFAMRVSDMGIAQRELADASVLIDREKRKSGSLSYVVVAVFRARHCFRDRERAVTGHVPAACSSAGAGFVRSELARSAASDRSGVG